MSSATRHFIDRAVERLGYTAPQAAELAEKLVWAVQNQRDDIAAFVARVNRNGGRLFRFQAVNGQAYYALVDTEKWTCVTVMPPGFVVGREGKPRLQLKETYL
jgi:hypothetical protein